MKRIISLFVVAMLATASFYCNARKIVLPHPLLPGDTIALITPASATGASEQAIAEAIHRWGYNVKAMPFAFSHRLGSYTASPEERAEDLITALTDPGVKAIICTRGGFGSVQLLPYLDPTFATLNPKWLVGFSDISALHAWMFNAGVASIHGPVGSELPRYAVNPQDSLSAMGRGPAFESVEYLRRILDSGKPQEYTFDNVHHYNNHGEATGRLVGGNFIVVNNLALTPEDVFDPLTAEDPDGVILYLEETGEEIYAIERMLIRLHQSGFLKEVKGIILGQFIKAPAGQDFRTVEDMFHTRLKEWGYYETSIPIIYDFPIGHGPENFPMVNGALVRLSSSPTVVRLSPEN